MPKPVLAVDIDEVLFPFVQEFVAHHNKTYATKLAQDDFFSYHFEEVIKDIDLEEAVRRVKDFTGGQHDVIEPVQHAKEGVSRLAQRYDLVLLTARHPAYRANTLRWVEQHFPGAFRDLRMIGYERDSTITPTTKAQVCRELDAVALVDDSTKYISQAVESGIRGILFGNYPWNQQVDLPEGVIRVNDWLDLAEHLDA